MNPLERDANTAETAAESKSLDGRAGDFAKMIRAMRRHFDAPQQLRERIYEVAETAGGPRSRLVLRPLSGVRSSKPVLRGSFEAQGVQVSAQAEAVGSRYRLQGEVVPPDADLQIAGKRLRLDEFGMFLATVDLPTVLRVGTGGTAIELEVLADG